MTKKYEEKDGVFALVIPDSKEDREEFFKSTVNFKNNLEENESCVLTVVGSEKDREKLFKEYLDVKPIFLSLNDKSSYLGGESYFGAEESYKVTEPLELNLDTWIFVEGADQLLSASENSLNENLLKSVLEGVIRLSRSTGAKLILSSDEIPGGESDFSRLAKKFGDVLLLS